MSRPHTRNTDENPVNYRPPSVRLGGRPRNLQVPSLFVAELVIVAATNGPAPVLWSQLVEAPADGVGAFARALLGELAGERLRLNHSGHLLISATTAAIDLPDGSRSPASS